MAVQIIEMATVMVVVPAFVPLLQKTGGTCSTK
jgi:hypothetical protein